MFTLTIGKRQLLLDIDFGVSLIYVNPCWCFNEIPAPLCLDVTIPDNDLNRNILGHPGRFAKMAKSNDRKFPGAELRWCGYLYIYGTLVITKPTEKGYSGYIQSELRSLSDAQREKRIVDHQLGGDILFQNKTTYNPDTDLYCTIRLSNAGFWVDKGEMEDWKKPIVKEDGTPGFEDSTREVLTRKFEETAEFLVNAPTAEGVMTQADGEGVVVVSPFPFLSKMIELILQENRFFIRNSFMSEDDIIKTICLYHNISICKSQEVTILRNTTVMQKYHVQTSYAGSIVITEEIQSQIWNTDTFKLNKLLPKMKLSDLLLSTQNITNTFFHFTGIDDVDNIDRESLFDMEPFDLSKYRISRWIPAKRQNLCLKFSMERDSDDQEFNENFSDISSREDDILEPVKFFADLTAAGMPAPVIGNIRLVEVEKMYYEYRQETVNEKEVLMWAPLTVDLQDYKYNKQGNETEEIKTSFSTLRMHENGYPVAYQKGTSSQFSQFTENFGPRLLFYNGNNTGGSSATDGLALDWKSLVSRRYRRTAPFYANALQVEAEFRLPGNIFYKVLNEIYKPFLDRDGSFFIKEMQVQANNSEFVNATFTVFKNEDNVFESSSQTVDGSGEHANPGSGGNEGGPGFTPVLVGMSEYGQPMLIDAAGQHMAMSVFGQLSSADFSKYTCSDYDSAAKLLFVGGNNGQLHVCDLSDMDNLRYKTIQVFAGIDEISAVSLVNSGAVKTILVGKANGCQAWAQPYHSVFDQYVSGEAVQTAAFDHGTGHLRGFIWASGYYHACSRNGEIFRTNSLATMWNQVADIDGSGGYNAEFIAIAQSATKLWTAEINDDSLYALKSNSSQYYRYGGLSGAARQKLRALQSTIGDKMLMLCDEAVCIWEVNLDSNVNRNITPAGIVKAGGACFDGLKFARIAVMDSAGYPKIGIYNAAPVFPEAVWSYQNVAAFMQKLWNY